MRRFPHYALSGALLIALGTGLLSGCGGVSAHNSTPNAALTPSSSTLSFGSVQNSQSARLSETLTNTGDSAVTISAATASGAGFSVSGLSLPMTLSAGQSVSFNVTFAPASPGTVTGMLAVTSSASDSQLDISLSGQGVGPGQLAVSPSTLGFGSVVVGANSALSGSLQATGAAVTISSAGINNNQFVLSGISLPITLAAGQSASFTITFTPPITGAVTGKLSFGSDAGNSPSTETLTGTGTAPVQHSANLSWDGSSGQDVAGYNVYRGTSPGGPYSILNSGLQAGNSYSDGTVAAGQTYYYVTTAVGGDGEESVYSDQAQAVIPNQ